MFHLSINFWKRALSTAQRKTRTLRVSIPSCRQLLSFLGTTRFFFSFSSSLSLSLIPHFLLRSFASPFVSTIFLFFLRFLPLSVSFCLSACRSSAALCRSLPASFVTHGGHEIVSRLTVKVDQWGRVDRPGHVSFD